MFWREEDDSEAEFRVPDDVFDLVFRLRGSRLDPFGYSAERRSDRALITEFRDRVTRALADLTPETYATAVDIASVPGDIRGFGHVREASLEQARDAWARLAEELADPSLRGTDAVRIIDPLAA